MFKILNKVIKLYLIIQRGYPQTMNKKWITVINLKEKLNIL